MWERGERGRGQMRLKPSGPAVASGSLTHPVLVVLYSGGQGAPDGGCGEGKRRVKNLGKGAELNIDILVTPAQRFSPCIPLETYGKM